MGPVVEGDDNSVRGLSESADKDGAAAGLGIGRFGGGGGTVLRGMGCKILSGSRGDAAMRGEGAESATGAGMVDELVFEFRRFRRSSESDVPSSPGGTGGGM